MKPILSLLLLLCLSANAQQKFTVYFDFALAEATTQSGQKLSEWIVQNPKARIQKIYGYADKTGDEPYNQDLSEKRALFVFEKLKVAGLYLESVDERGFGESKATAERNAKDRKVEIYYAVPAVEPPPAAPVGLTEEVATAKVGDKIQLKGLNFYNNSDGMLTESRPVMAELIAILKANPKLKIQIQGHVCCQAETEMKISQLRALAVYKGLVANGIDTGRLSYTSFGNTRPIYPIPEKNEDEKIANRRVEIEIVAN